MSNDELDIDFGSSGEVDFGLAKELKLPAEGTYILQITDYEVKQSKNPESKGKGVNCAVKFKFDDPESVETEDGDEQDFAKFPLFDNIWVHFENPFGAKNFFEAVSGEELTGTFNIKDPSNFIGERVGVILTIEPDYKNPKIRRTKIVPQSYFSA